MPPIQGNGNIELSETALNFASNYAKAFLAGYQDGIRACSKAFEICANATLNQIVPEKREFGPIRNRDVLYRIFPVKN